MIVQDILYNARALIDEYNTGGVINPSSDSDMKELETNGIVFVNMGLREAYKKDDYYKTMEVSHKRMPNLLGDMSQFNKVDFIGIDQVYPDTMAGVVGAKAYYVEPDSDYTIYIQEYDGATWNTIDTITGTTDAPVRLKGSITPTDDSYPIQMVMSGTTFYRHQNRCLFSYPYKDNAIPEFRPWIPIELPEDFAELVEIIDEYPEREQNKDGNYKQEGRKTFYINYFYEGTLRFIYHPFPQEVTTVNDVVYLNNPQAVEFVNNFVAARMATIENPSLVNFYESKANEIMFELTKSGPASEETITDVYWGNNYG